jgi:hypothetical protein
LAYRVRARVSEAQELQTRFSNRVSTTPARRFVVYVEKAGAQPKVRLSKVDVCGNCKPSVANDPIIAHWIVDISFINKPGAGIRAFRSSHASFCTTTHPTRMKLA